jgi:putative intracellular protease/amidase
VSWLLFFIENLKESMGQLNFFTKNPFNNLDNPMEVQMSTKNVKFRQNAGWIVYSILLLLFFSLSEVIYSRSRTSGNGKERNNPRVLVLVAQNVGLNYFLFRDNLQSAGYDLVNAGVTRKVSPCPPLIPNFDMPKMNMDILTTEIKDLKGYDAILIAPASGDYNPVKNPFEDLLNDKATLRLLQEAVYKDVPVFSICSGVRLIARAGVIKGKKIIGPKKFRDEIEQAGGIWIDKKTSVEESPPIMVQGNIITGSRGLRYNYYNAQVIRKEVEKRHSVKNKFPAKFEFIERVFKNEAVVWGKTYGSKASDGATKVISAPDGGFTVAGYTYGIGNGDSDIFLMNTDQEGKKRWVKTYGAQGFEYALDCLGIKDGYLIVGYTTSNQKKQRDILLVRTDLKGRDIWQKTYGGSDEDVALAAAEIDDGYIIAGYSRSFSSGEEDILIIKTDNNGQVIWKKTYGEKTTEIAKDLVVNQDGTITILGIKGPTEKSEAFKYYLLKISENGNLLWEKTYTNEKRISGYGYNWPSAIRAVKDRKGWYQVIGTTDAYDIHNGNVFVVDDKGELKRMIDFGETAFYDYAISATKTGGNIFAIASITSSVHKQDNDILVTRNALGGGVIAKKIIRADGSDMTFSILDIGSGEFIIAGQTNSFGAGGFDVLLAKVKF